MAELKIASMNVRGIGNNNKRRETFNWLRNKQQSIIFLQEAHCTEATIDTWRSERGYKALFSCFSGSSAGVCILFNNTFKFDILKTFSVPSGRYIVCDIKTDEKLFTPAYIYAPNEDDPSFFKQVFDRLHDFACEEIIIIIIGLQLESAIVRVDCQVKDNIICEQLDGRLNIHRKVVNVQKEKSRSNRGALGDHWQDRQVGGLFTIYCNALLSIAEKAFNPRTCVASNSVAVKLQ